MLMKAFIQNTYKTTRDQKMNFNQQVLSLFRDEEDLSSLDYFEKIYMVELRERFEKQYD